MAGCRRARISQICRLPPAAATRLRPHLVNLPPVSGRRASGVSPCRLAAASPGGNRTVSVIARRPSPGSCRAAQALVQRVPIRTLKRTGRATPLPMPSAGERVSACRTRKAKVGVPARLHRACGRQSDPRGRRPIRKPLFRADPLCPLALGLEAVVPQR